MLFIVANKRMAQLVPRRLCVVAAATFLWMTSSQPPAEDMIDDIWEESVDNGETWRPNPSSIPTTNSGCQKFERKLYKRIIRQQR